MTENAPTSQRDPLQVVAVDDSILENEAERSRLRTAIGAKLGQMHRESKTDAERKEFFEKAHKISSLLQQLGRGSFDDPEGISTFNAELEKLGLIGGATEVDTAAPEPPVETAQAEPAPAPATPPAPESSAPRRLNISVADGSRASEAPAAPAATPEPAAVPTPETAPAAPGVEKEVTPEAKENVGGVLDRISHDLDVAIDNFKSDTELTHADLYHRASSEHSDEYAAVFTARTQLRKRIARWKENPTAIDLDEFRSLRDELKAKLEEAKHLILDQPRDPDSVTPEGINSVLGAPLPESGAEHAMEARDFLRAAQREVAWAANPAVPMDPRIRSAIALIGVTSSRINTTNGLPAEKRAQIQAAAANLEQLLPRGAAGQSFRDRVALGSREYLTTPYTRQAAAPLTPPAGSEPAPDTPEAPRAETDEAPPRLTPKDVAAIAAAVEARLAGRMPGYHPPEAKRSRRARNLGLAALASIAVGAGAGYVAKQLHKAEIAQGERMAAGKQPEATPKAERSVDLLTDEVIEGKKGEYFTTKPMPGTALADALAAEQTKPVTPPTPDLLTNEVVEGQRAEFSSAEPMPGTALADALASERAKPAAPPPPPAPATAAPAPQQAEGAVATEVATVGAPLIEPVLANFDQEGVGVSAKLDELFDAGLHLPVPLSKEDFDHLKEEVLAEIEADPALEEEVASEAGIASGDINVVALGSEADLTGIVNRIVQKAMQP